MEIRWISLASSSGFLWVTIAPLLDLLQHVTRFDSPHSARAVLHGDGIILPWLTIRIDDEIVVSVVRPGALWIRVTHQTDDRTVQRHAHVQRTGIGRKDQRRRIENRDEVSQAAPQL